MLGSLANDISVVTPLINESANWDFSEIVPKKKISSIASHTILRHKSVIHFGLGTFVDDIKCERPLQCSANSSLFANNSQTMKINY